MAAEPCGCMLETAPIAAALFLAIVLLIVERILRKGRGTTEPLLGDKASERDFFCCGVDKKMAAPIALDVIGNTRPSEEMNTEALGRLADKLQGSGPYPLPIPSSQFSMLSWQAPDDTCGSAVCALGWAATDPWFNARGFAMTSRGRWGKPIYQPQFAAGSNPGPVCGYSGAAKFFGLSSSATTYMFHPDSYPDPLQVGPGDVAVRIREHVGSH